ncbi:NAD-dependent epimerase/dehydratase family protein [Amycolatopsis sp.]|jgi:nucleoside-diphosphate-sugar epimerase|uniref:NAD-dependent epimerase/dehydratase family protein n=1 Tax=Amycolatopsis sp. TaxID=37632 RepID=UPI002E033E20|nr:NAD-dependent epimerase/dehydratase family protein [Amycolatopsis sp.]
MGITVAVTGPTGEIGISAVSALERDGAVDRILGMARRPFDPGEHGWTKTEYRQGDILDRDAVEELTAAADVVIHLAFVIMGTRDASRRINLAGTRNVFEATVAAARPKRLVYTSSVAAYGYHADNPLPITEDVPPRGSSEHYYSEQKAECEDLLAEATEGSDLEVYVLRPCIVAGPHATALADSMPWKQLGARLPDAVVKAARAVPGLRPVLPDPGTPLQLVHHDDVANAIAIATTTTAPPGAYNLAGDGEISLTDIAHALGAHAVRIPSSVATAASDVLAKLPRVPAVAEWVHGVRTSVVMDTTKAKRDLGWVPKYSSAETLEAMAGGL